MAPKAPRSDHSDVQAPTKFKFVLNLRTAKALGIEPPLPTLLRADELIE
jgi:putative tryptophan/tyrosine transport system substrate-binding protein